MNFLPLPLHRGLSASSRLAPWLVPADRLRLGELGILLGAGAAAALAVAYLDFGLRVPGHAILRAVLPMALGLSLAPRRMGGAFMGGSACATVVLLKAAGGSSPGIGALTSLCLIGPLLDAALWRARSGWPVYLCFALAGCGANLVAFAMRGTKKLAGLDALTQRPLTDWLTTAPWSYILCGTVAGLLSAAIWFRLRAPGETQQREESP